MRWLIPIFLTGCAAVADDSNELYECRVLGQYLICVPQRANA